MLRYGDRLSLSELDIRRWTRITGFEPVDVRTVADLNGFVAECKRYYDSPSKDSAFIHWLIDVELERYGGPPATAKPVLLEAVTPDDGRVSAERELLWNIALDGDRSRRDQLMRALAAPPE